MPFCFLEIDSKVFMISLWRQLQIMAGCTAIGGTLSVVKNQNLDFSISVVLGLFFAGAVYFLTSVILGDFLVKFLWKNAGEKPRNSWLKLIYFLNATWMFASIFIGPLVAAIFLKM